MKNFYIIYIFFDIISPLFTGSHLWNIIAYSIILFNANYSMLKKQKSHALCVTFFGAGSGGRTRTVSLPLDFESSTSANSIIPAFISTSVIITHCCMQCQVLIYYFTKKTSTKNNKINSVLQFFCQLLKLLNICDIMIIVYYYLHIVIGGYYV